MKKRGLALLLAGVMCIAAGGALAESAEAFDVVKVAPLLSAVTSAALGAPEETVSLSTEEPMPADFAARLATALTMNGLDAAAMSDLVAMEIPDGLAADAAVERVDLIVTATDVSEDGDAAMFLGEVNERRVIIELRQDDASPLGWKLYSFAVDDALLVEQVTENFFGQTMLEYVNTACGYSIQYPALFTDDLLVETDSGIQAALADDSASFSVTRLDNAEGLTLEALLAREKENDPNAETSTDEMTGSGRSVIADAEDGVIHVAIFLVSGEYIYQAELNYRQDLAETYEPYVDYMTNSFSADELGLG